MRHSHDPAEHLRPISPLRATDSHVDPSNMASTAAGGATAKDMVEAGMGERFSVCKSTVFPPSKHTPAPGSEQPPANELELEWVYGYRGADCYAFGHGTFGSHRLTSQVGRNNLLWAANDEGIVDGSTIVFFASAVGVVMHIRQRRQVGLVQHHLQLLLKCCVSEKWLDRTR